MDINYYKQYEPIFGVWTITRLIGEGGFGKVFEMERVDFGKTYRAALKAVTIPASEDELLAARADGMDDASIRDYFGSYVQDLSREFDLMNKLKGNSNVVSYENHQVIEHRDGIGWDILIQMELLTPLNKYIVSNTITQRDIIQLGIDLCNALELCQKFNIIHRDIKPENIFVSEVGNFKLGDFGISRTADKTSGMTKTGTEAYMAPEVYKGEPYHSTVDIYSLGLVLYRLLNGNRLPFFPPAPAPVKPEDRDNAVKKRFSGAPLPPPCHARGRLGEIVLKACSYDPRDRYSSPVQMRQELEVILYSREEGPYIFTNGDDVPQDSVHYVKTGDRPAGSTQGKTTFRSFTGGRTASNFSGTFNRTTSDFGGTFTGGDRTASDFSGTFTGGDRTTSNFGGTFSGWSRTDSNFGGMDSGRAQKKYTERTPPKPPFSEKKDSRTGPNAAPANLAAQMLPACAVVPLGPNRTTWGLAESFTDKEWKFVNTVTQKYGLQDYGEILGYCGVILNITIPYGIIFTSTGIIFPNMVKVAKFLLESTVHHKYLYLPYKEIRAVELYTEKKLLGIRISLGNEEERKFVLPDGIYVHRTNVCKLIEAMCGYYGNQISFRN